MIAFLNGVAQFFAPSHLLAVIALGMLVGQDARQLPLKALAAFALGLALGSLIVATAIRENPASLALLILAATTGGLVVLAANVPCWLPPPVVFAGGSALSLNAPPQEFTVAAAIASQFGVATAGIAVFGLAALISASARTSWPQIGVRIGASWIVASAILVLALRLAR